MKDKSATNSVPTGEVELNDSKGYLKGLIIALVQEIKDNILRGIVLSFKALLEKSQNFQEIMIMQDF